MISMSKRIIIDVMLLLLVMLVSGCKDSRDINKKMIATTIAVDKVDGEVWFYMEYANIKAGRSGETGKRTTGEKYMLVKVSGKTFADARTCLNRQLENPLYLSGTQTLLLTERLAKEDIVEYLYRLRADDTYRKKVITLTTRDDLDELFQSINERDQSVGYSGDKLIETLDALGESFSRSTARLLENLSNEYTGILIPCIGLNENVISLVGYSVVNDTKVIGFLPIKEAKGLIILKAEKPKATFVVPYKDVRYTIETNLMRRKVIPSYEDGDIRFTLSYEFQGELLYGNKKTPYNITEKEIDEINSVLKGMMKNELYGAIEQAQKKYKTDYLQLDDAFRVKYPELFEKMDWQTEFVNANIRLKLKLDLRTAPMLHYDEKETK